MSILLTPARNVNTAGTARRFGAGILPTAPTYAVDRTLADELWWAAESNAAEDRRADRDAAESLATAALTDGYTPADAGRAARSTFPRDLAETIARTRRGGHDC